MKVYLVYEREKQGSASRVLAVCADEEDANLLAETLASERYWNEYSVSDRTLIYGQPTKGYNP